MATCKRPISVVAIILACASAATGCGATEADARSHLEAKGYTITELTKDKNAFKFTAKKGNQICTGSLTINKGANSSSHSLTTRCKRDTSACKAGATATCMTIANELYNQDKSVFPRTAAKLYRIACGDKNALACARVAEFERIGKNWPMVRQFSQKGCTLGNGQACHQLAQTEFSGHGTSVDKTKALAFFKDACTKGFMRGCRDAGGMLIDGDGVTADPVAGATLMEKPCAAKHKNSCLILGIALYQSAKLAAKKGPKTGAAKTYERALGHLQTGCEKAAAPKNLRAMSCNRAGVILSNGLGVPKDSARAVTLFEKACGFGSGHGCSNAASHYKLGRGVKRDTARVKELHAKACSLGLKKHCK